MQRELDRLEEWANKPYEIKQEQIQNPGKKKHFLGTASLEAALRKAPDHEPTACSGNKDIQQHPQRY